MFAASLSGRCVALYLSTQQSFLILRVLSERICLLVLLQEKLLWVDAAPVVRVLFVQPALTLAVCGCFRRDLLARMVRFRQLRTASRF